MWTFKRAQQGKQWIEQFYFEQGKENYVDVAVYQDYREMLQDKSIDAVIISTPDHWHAQPAMEAALAGKGYLPAETGLAHHPEGAANE